MDQIRNKLLSGRWITTVALSITFCKMAWTGTIPAEVFVPVFIVVVNYYFRDKDRKEGAPNV